MIPRSIDTPAYAVPEKQSKIDRETAILFYAIRNKDITGIYEQIGQRGCNIVRSGLTYLAPHSFSAQIEDHAIYIQTVTQLQVEDFVARGNVEQPAQMEEPFESLTIAVAAATLTSTLDINDVFHFVNKQIDAAGYALSHHDAASNWRSPIWLYYLYARRQMDRYQAYDPNNRLTKDVILSDLERMYLKFFPLHPQ